MVITSNTLVKKLLIFYLLLVSISFLAIVAATIAKVPLTSIAAFYMLTPLLATLLYCKLTKIKIKDISPKIFTGDYLLLAIGMGLVIPTITLLVSLLFGYHISSSMEGLVQYGFNRSYLDFILKGKGPIQVFMIQLVLAGLYGSTINALFAYCEEIAWRGLLFEKLKRLGFWKASLIIGFVWGLWHIPLILSGYNYPMHPRVGVLFMIVFCILLSPFLIFIRSKSSSVLIPSIMHGTINGSGAIAIAFLSMNNDLVTGITGISGFIVLIATNLTLFLSAKAKQIQL
jgi:membrane protease YdiL (CAAX protease family)